MFVSFGSIDGGGFRRGRRQVAPEFIEAIRRAFSRVGVEFIDENGGGPGVRLRKRPRAKPSKRYMVGLKPSVPLHEWRPRRRS